MASTVCANDTWTARSYEGGWHSWYTDFTQKSSDGYCHTNGSSITYAYCFSFQTPSITNFYQSSKLTIKIPVVRTGSGFAKSGTLYFKLLTSDPTPSTNSGGINDNLKPSSSDCDASYSWSITDQQVHTISFNIASTSLKPNTRYYITVGGNKVLGIGYGPKDGAGKNHTPATGDWVATLHYSTYTNGTDPSITITDRGDNTCLISGVLGTEGTNNKLSSATLYYTTNGEEPNSSDPDTTKVSLTAKSGGSYSKSIAIPSSCSIIWAVVYCKFAYNQTNTKHTSKSVKYYAAPGNPGIPTLTTGSFKNNRLTVKQNWTYSWTAAVGANTNSPIKGYRIRLWKNGTTTPIKDSSGNQLSEIRSGSTGDYIYDRESTSTSITIDPVINSFKAGDEVELSIFAYTRNGKEEQLFSGGAVTSVISEKTAVENAGIVKFKTAGSWVEGQVWVKANNAWYEAETVSTKVAGSWKESQ